MSTRRRHIGGSLLVALSVLPVMACIEGHPGDTSDGIMGPPPAFPTPSGVAVVAGRVYDQRTGIALPGARVHISTVETFADSLGDYRLSGIAAGFVVLEAQREGYQARWMQVPLSPGTNAIPLAMVAQFPP
jgi:hypothetical protein